MKFVKKANSGNIIMQHKEQFKKLKIKLKNHFRGEFMQTNLLKYRELVHVYNVPYTCTNSQFTASQENIVTMIVT